MACTSIRDEDEQIREPDPRRNQIKTKQKSQEMGEAGGRGGLTRLSGEGRLIDLDPTIGGSLGEAQKSTTMKHFPTESKEWVRREAPPRPAPLQLT
jgi:hypothetical protein